MEAVHSKPERGPVENGGSGARAANLESVPPCNDPLRDGRPGKGPPERGPRAAAAAAAAAHAAAPGGGSGPGGRKGGGGGAGPSSRRGGGGGRGEYAGESKGGLTRLTLAGHQVEGVSVGGQETCVLLPALRVAFDIGRCPQRAVAQDHVLISHAHMDHLGGIGFHVGTRDLLSMKPPTVLMPAGDVALTRVLLETYRRMDRSWEELPEDERHLRVKLHGIDVGEEHTLASGWIARPFKTYHCIPSQGYVLYSSRRKLKPEYMGLPANKIKELRLSGVEITDVIEEPEVAFTGDTTADWITDPANGDALRAKLLIMEVTFVDDAVTTENARKYGHTTLREVVALKDHFKNAAILFIHFSARYKRENILEAMAKLPPGLKERAHALMERF